jgi:TolB-like protein
MKKIIIILLALLFSFNSNILYAQESPLIKTIAVLDFENNTGLLSQDGLRKGLSGSLTNSLSGYKKISVLERSRLNDAINEISFNQSGMVSNDTASKIGKIVGTQYVVLGSVSRLGEIFEVAIRLVDVESSKVTFSKAIRSQNEESIYKSMDYLSLEIANNLGEEIDPRIIDQSRKDAENFIKNTNNNLLWIGGGILGAIAVGGIIIAVIASNKTTKNVQNVCIGSDCTSTENKPASANFSNIGFGFKF